MRGLSAIAKTLGADSDEKLDEKIASLKLERRQIARATKPFREVAHQAADELVTTAGQRFAAAVMGSQGHLPTEPRNPTASELAVLHTMASESFGAHLHRSIDADGFTFSEGTLVEHEAKVAKLDAQIAELELELQRRQGAAKVAEAEAELAALTATEGS